MARKRTTIRSNFKAVKGAAKEAIDDATREALVTGQEEHQRRIENTNSQRGYDLDPFVARRKEFGGGEGGMIFVHSDNWYYKFFEYGTTYIPASPAMRPAARKMGKAFRDGMGDKLEPTIRRKAQVRR